ncbi:cofilin [Protomyces lactucae-debilis]|uniref:Cofilin n=1 Tax=Protomyces lactucae-debilis TaxID=2754530 RepID=A0A1Y2EQT8_PROLT|nr:cofilin [Protomyces lactucae-debilis]ORY73909.1 cofilin [Protomyces lactucae-debilis]
MPASGVILSDECVKAFNELKLGKTLRYVIYTFNSNNTEIVVEHKSDSGDWEDFTAKLPENECRYAVYDVKYEKGGDGVRSKLVFIFWAPDTAKVKSKMVSASSKDTIRRALNGVGIEVQATDSSEVEYDAVLEKVQRLGF